MQHTKNSTVFRIVLLTLTFIFTLNSPCLSAESYEIPFSKGMLYFNQGKYEEALQTFTKAIELKSDLATIYYYLGLTHAQLGNNWEALTAFEKTISLDSTYPRVYYDLGVVYYRMGNYPHALKSFEMAEKREPERAMIYYFKAHILYLQNKFFESLPYFTKAGELDPGLKQTTHFFSGLALLKLDRKKEAEQELQSSLTIDPTSELGNAAQGYLDSIKAKQPRALKKWNLTASLSYQYDDNVVLEPDGASSTTDVSHEGDSRGVVFIDGEYRFIQTLPWIAGVRYTFYQSIHSRLHDYDLQNHQGMLFGSYQGHCGSIPYQFQLDYNYRNSILNEKRYLESHGITGTLNLQWNAYLLTQLQYRFQDKDFHYDITHPTANRDGSNNLVGVTQYLFLFNNRGFLRVGYFYDNDSTKGSNWDYDGYKALVGLRVPFLFETSIDTDLEYYQQEYDNHDYFFNHCRRDEEYTYNFSLYRNLYKLLDAMFTYTRIDNGSNIDFYDYDRNIYSFTLSLRF